MVIDKSDIVPGKKSFKPYPSEHDLGEKEKRKPGKVDPKTPYSNLAGLPTCTPLHTMLPPWKFFPKTFALSAYFNFGRWC